VVKGFSSLLSRGKEQPALEGWMNNIVSLHNYVGKLKRS